MAVATNQSTVYNQTTTKKLLSLYDAIPIYLFRVMSITEGDPKYGFIPALYDAAEEFIMSPDERDRELGKVFCDILLNDPEYQGSSCIIDVDNFEEF